MIKNSSIQTEVDASYLYAKLADNESDVAVANVFKQMSEIEEGHAIAFLEQLDSKRPVILPGPSFRAKALNFIGKTFSYDYVLGVLMDTEKVLANAVVNAKRSMQIPLTGT